MGSYEDMGFNTPPPVFDDLGFDDEILPQVEERSANLPVPTDEVSLIDTFGEFAISGVSDGGVVRLPEPVGNTKEVRVHKKLQKVMQAFVDKIHSEGLWWMVKAVSGYSQETRPGSQRYKAERKISITSWGAALVINANYNLHGEAPGGPVGEPAVSVSRGEPGFTFYPGHPIVAIAEELGLTWAGRKQFSVMTPEGDAFQDNDVPLPANFMYIKAW